MNTDLIIATRNASKLEQIHAGLAHIALNIKSLSDFGIQSVPDEDGQTLEENAMKKARFVFQRFGPCWVLADDTGLFIDCLGGEPGVTSARWAGVSASTEDTMNYCLDRLRDASDRSARFETVMVLINPERNAYVFSGTVHGQILEAPRCTPQPNMPYSALFLPNGSNQVWAEMTVAEENAISHRGIALSRVAKFLESDLRSRITPK